MKDLIKQMNDIESSFKNMRTLTLATVLAAICTVVITFLAAMYVIREERKHVYILEDGRAMAASRTGETLSRDMEIRDHMIRFHELFFNLAPSADAIRSNVDRALTMADKSAYDYYNDMKESNFYSRIVSANITQQISVDSVKINMSSYPYKVETYCSEYVLRGSSISEFRLVTYCNVVDTHRSQNNPHGLMIEKFIVDKNELVSTKNR